MSSDRNDDQITFILLLVVSRSAFKEKPSDALCYDIQF